MPALPDRWRQAIAASFLGRLPERTVLDLFDRAHEVEAPAHTVLYSEADDSRSARLVVVLDGLIRVYRTSRSGREVTLRHARRGDVLGLPAMVTEASPAAAQVVVAARVVFISAQTVRARAQLDSRLAWAVAEELAGSLFNIQERLGSQRFRCGEESGSSPLTRCGGQRWGPAGCHHESQKTLQPPLGRSARSSPEQ